MTPPDDQTLRRPDGEGRPGGRRTEHGAPGQNGTEAREQGTGHARASGCAFYMGNRQHKPLHWHPHGAKNLLCSFKATIAIENPVSHTFLHKIWSQIFKIFLIFLYNQIVKSSTFSLFIISYKFGKNNKQHSLWEPLWI